MQQELVSLISLGHAISANLIYIIFYLCLLTIPLAIVESRQ